MGKYHISMTQTFNAPVGTIFDILTDHQSFGEVTNANIKRVVDSQDENKNGVGSVRRISAFPAPAFEETVVVFEPDQLMEYVVSKGSPIKNHRGRLEFSEAGGKTRLNYTIDFDVKLPFVFIGAVIKSAIEKSIAGGLKRLSGRYDA